MPTIQELIEQHIRDVPDFPKPGILFKDITPVVQDAHAFASIIDHFKERYDGADLHTIVGVESRGFIFGAALAYAMGKGFTLVRKPGKLPARIESIRYELEYGTDELQIHADAISKGQRVLVIDDLLATGGTAAATCQLIHKLGGDVVECGFVIELAFLGGRDRIEPTPSYSAITY